MQTERPRRLEISESLQVGPHKKIALIPGSAGTVCDHDDRQPGRLIMDIDKVGGGILQIMRGRGMKLTVLYQGLSHNALYHQALGTQDSNLMFRSTDQLDRIWAALLFGGFSFDYKELTVKEPRQYELGLVLADFFDLLPSDVAAAHLLGAADPQIAHDAMKGEYSAEMTGTNIQSKVVETIALLPSVKRQELFSTMSHLDAGARERTNRLVSLIAANFNNNRSPVCAPRLIQMNFSGDIERTADRLGSLREDLPKLRSIVRE